jgi:hypothetical protein
VGFFEKLMTPFEIKCDKLMRRHGYKLLAEGNSFRIVSMAIAGFTSDEIQPFTFRSAFSAVEHLIPICGKDYHDDYSSTFKAQLAFRD